MLEINEKFKTRSWVFTIFENVEEGIDLGEIQKRLNKRGNKSSVKYLISGFETCPTTKRLHLQGAVYFKNAKTRKELQSWTNKKKWKHFCEPWRGTAAQNKKYCSKDGDYIECGDATQVFQQGKRNDISLVKEALNEGANLRTIIKSATSNQSVQFACKWLTYLETKRNWKPQVKWFWGVAGSGKSRKAWEEMPEAYDANETSQWWDGYDAHEDVIIDDIRGNFSTFNNFLKLIDRYPHRIQIKGGFRQFLAKRIIITSCYPPQQIWSMCGENMNQLMRRIDEVIEFKKPTEVKPTEVAKGNIKTLATKNIFSMKLRERG